MNKKYFCLEFAGVFFILAGAAFMRRMYALTDFGLAGVLFGSVNSSPWEFAKTLLLPFLFWGMIELLCLGRLLHRLAVAKALSLCFLLLLYLSASSLFLRGKDFGNFEIIAAVLSVLAAQLLSFILMKYGICIEGFFPAALCMLFLLLAFYFSFTPFPPRNFLFADRISGQYGIPPLGYDFGADIL
ncbi:MAG TPA: hypothetical protein DEO32_04155 [Ruminococcaceae bacterium]|nr:hypothetical protein [Oscillospiraceae bacterium]